MGDIPNLPQLHPSVGYRYRKGYGKKILLPHTKFLPPQLDVSDAHSSKVFLLKNFIS
ncbi:hypothetical protein ZOSMA_151G00020 [Zostera marina]|uniref:Uncharacterized protein n=1 Tax=Zostera marina TaxID=29655 RepID=A0A0K9PW13_ZOSMR|nr:hypothetical protein ZOSMA_151G00020 [Zostera marina]